MIRNYWRLAAVFVAYGMLACGPFAAISAADSILVVNPGFDFDASNPGANGYGPVHGWTSNEDEPRTGMNSPGQPFVGSTLIPDFQRVGFIQRSTNPNYFTTLSQGISGLDPNKQYWFQIHYNARQDSFSDPPIMHVTYGDQVLVDHLTVPKGNPTYTFLNVAFTPGASSGALAISNRDGTTQDSTLLIDGISIIERDPNHVVIANPSFEGSQARGGAGYSGGLDTNGNPTNMRIAGWISQGKTGINPLVSGSSPFSVGAVPEGGVAAFIQHDSTQDHGEFSSLSQALPSLMEGATYELRFFAAGRQPFSTNPTLTVTLGDRELLTQILPSNGTYNEFALQFTANANDVNPLLTFKAHAQSGEATVFLDNVSLQLIPEPSAFAFGALGLALLAVRKRRRGV